MNYEETLDYLFTKLPMYQRVGDPALKFSLDNIRALMKTLGNPHNKVKTVHIAGTNGKGSSAHMLSSILQESGYKAGLHTSPHLKSFTERIRLNGIEVDDRFVVEFTERIQPEIKRIKPSFFEITFAMAMDYFAAQEVDIAIIEVGMGGRLDSTNIITPEVCLITNISLDHQNLLGDTIEEIAGEKAGIIKPAIPVVIGQTQKMITDVFDEKAKTQQAPIYYAEDEYRVEQAYDGRVNIIKGGAIELEGLRLDLKGDYQNSNLPGILKVADILKDNGWNRISEKSITDGLENVIRNTGLKGRWQQLDKEPLIITDTGHNEAGLEVILNQLNQTDYEELHLIWGMVKDKDISTILKMLPKAANYYFVEPSVPRAMPVAELKRLATSFGLNGLVYPSVNAALQAAKKTAGKNDLIFIGGSTFVVAEIDDL